MGNNTETQLLTVDFYEVNAGWLYYKLTAGQQLFDNRFSHVYDPLPNLKHWLEAMSVGVQQTSFQYDNEGMVIKFNFERLSWQSEVLTISEVYDSERVFLKAKVDRLQTVKSIYLGLMNFGKSDKFSSKEWEIEYMKERLCKLIDVDEKTLIQELVRLKKNELGELLSKADPGYHVSYPNAKNIKEKLRMFVEDTIKKDQGVPIERKRVETLDEWPIPEDYNLWEIDKKREYIIECLNETTHGYDGMKIDDFSSLIIESFIDEK